MELITKSELSKRLGVSKAMISKLVKGVFSPALVNGRINIDADCVAEYARSKSSDISTPKFNEKKEESSIVADSEIPGALTDVKNFETMGLSELCEIFGTDERFKVWLNCRKTLTDIKIKELSLAESTGELVSREIVSHKVLEPIDSAHVKLLTDGAKTIAIRVTAMNNSGSSIDDVEKFVASQISSFIRPVKAKIARALKR